MRLAFRRIVAHVLADPTLAGYRVGIMGDLHIAPWRSTIVLRRAVDLINQSEPDLITLVGDYGYSIDRLYRVSRGLYRAVMPGVTRELGRLRARHGVCAVLGNHDLDAGGVVVEEALSSVGIRVLRDSHYDIYRDRSCLRVIGLDDVTRAKQPWRLDQDLLRGPSAVLILSHHPDFVLHDGDFPRTCPALVLSGHTHGGQIAFPGLGAPMTLSRVATRKFPAGFVPNERVGLYVTRGIGEQLPVRVLADRDVTLLELAPR
ncbi:MAG: metallophosphoesterase [Gemmatimonadaceae bacterium]